MTTEDPDGAAPAPDLRSRTVTWSDPRATAEAGRSMAGLDLLTAMLEGRIPSAPIGVLMGFSIVEVGVGRVVFEGRPDESAFNLIGTVHGGFVATLADTVTACAVHTILEAGVAYTSIDLNVTYLRPVTPERGPLRATGVVAKPGRRVAYATAEIVDVEGKLVAAATSSCLVMDGRAAR